MRKRQTRDEPLENKMKTIQNKIDQVDKEKLVTGTSLQLYRDMILTKPGRDVTRIMHSIRRNNLVQFNIFVQKTFLNELALTHELK